jgi:hypothetical protein
MNISFEINHIYSFFYSMSMQHILDYTTNFMVGYNQCFDGQRSVSKGSQRPEYIEREFNSKFRLSNQCLINSYSTWMEKEQIILDFSLLLWDEIFNFMKNKSTRTVVNE